MKDIKLKEKKSNKKSRKDFITIFVAVFNGLATNNWFRAYIVP